MNIMFFLKPKSETAYLYSDYTLRQALEKMEHYQFSAVPVINREGHYVGTLNEGDLLWYIKRKQLTDVSDMEDIPLKSIQRRWHNEPVKADCEIEDLIMTAMRQNFVPVIDDHQIFIGIVTRKDIMSYCYDTYIKEK